MSQKLTLARDNQIEQRVKDETRLLYLLTFRQAGSNWR